MFSTIKNLLTGSSASSEAPSSISTPKKKNVKDRTTETAKSLAKIYNEQTLTNFTSNSPADILNGIYKLMVKIQFDDKLEKELYDNQAEELNSETEKRHKEILKALGSLSFSKPNKPKEEGTPSGAEIKSGIKPETPAAPSGTPKEVPKGTSKQTPEPKAKTTKTVPEKPVAAKPVGTQPVTPKPVSQPPVVPPVGKGAAVVTTGILGTVSSQMAKAEAPHGPEAYTQANIPVGGKLKDPAHQIIKGNTDITTGKKFDKDLTEMTIGEVVELGIRRQQTIPRTTSAMGKYQFIASTLEERARSVFGENWRTVPFSKDNQDALNKSFIKSNAQKLTRIGVPVSTASLYMVHFSGNAEFAKNVINSSGDVKMQTLMAPGQAKSNPGIANKTVSEYKKHLSDKGYSFAPIDNKALQAEPILNTTAQIVNSNTLQNQELNEKLNQSIQGGQTINQTNLNISQPQQQRTSPQSGDDRSAYERKSKVK